MSSRANGTNFLALRLLLTERCNINCAFCHNEGQAGIVRDLDITGDELSCLLDAANARGLQQLKLSGGEPTLHPGFLDYARIACERVADVAVISNGVRAEPLVAAGRMGTRTAINLPELLPARYQKATRAPIASVLKTISMLADANIAISFNTYAKAIPDSKFIESIVAFARSVAANVKFLLPCQMFSLRQQLNVTARYEAALVQLGLQRIAGTPYDSTWVGNDGVGNIRIVKPWCPDACRAVDGWYRSLRIAADRTIRPCFGGAQASVPLDLRTSLKAGEALDRALAMTGSYCVGAHGLVLNRRAASRDLTESMGG